jgi:hypothetical protein
MLPDLRDFSGPVNASSNKKTGAREPRAPVKGTVLEN